MSVETEREMADRHVCEQVARIEQQEALIRRLEGRGLSIVAASELLASMKELLSEMQAHSTRLRGGRLTRGRLETVQSQPAC